MEHLLLVPPQLPILPAVKEGTRQPPQALTPALVVSQVAAAVAALPPIALIMLEAQTRPPRHHHSPLQISHPPCRRTHRITNPHIRNLRLLKMEEKIV